MAVNFKMLIFNPFHSEFYFTMNFTSDDKPRKVLNFTLKLKLKQRLVVTLAYLQITHASDNHYETTSINNTTKRGTKTFELVFILKIFSYSRRLIYFIYGTLVFLWLIWASDLFKFFLLF